MQVQLFSAPHPAPAVSRLGLELEGVDTLRAAEAAAVLPGATKLHDSAKQQRERQNQCLTCLGEMVDRRKQGNLKMQRY